MPDLSQISRRGLAATRVFPHRRTLVVGTIDHDTPCRAGDLARRPAVGARSPQADREWSSNRSAFHWITNPRRLGWARPCLRDGRRKTFSDICAKAIIWMALLTMVPTLFLTPPWW